MSKPAAGVTRVIRSRGRNLTGAEILSTHCGVASNCCVDPITFCGGDYPAEMYVTLTHCPPACQPCISTSKTTECSDDVRQIESYNAWQDGSYKLAYSADLSDATHLVYILADSIDIEGFTQIVTPDKGSPTTTKFPPIITFSGSFTIPERCDQGLVFRNPAGSLVPAAVIGGWFGGINASTADYQSLVASPVDCAFVAPCDASLLAEGGLYNSADYFVNLIAVKKSLLADNLGIQAFSPDVPDSYYGPGNIVNITSPNPAVTCYPTTATGVDLFATVEVVPIPTGIGVSGGVVFRWPTANLLLSYRQATLTIECFPDPEVPAAWGLTLASMVVRQTSMNFTDDAGGRATCSIANQRFISNDSANHSDTGNTWSYAGLGNPVFANGVFNNLLPCAGVNATVVEITP